MKRQISISTVVVALVLALGLGVVALAGPSARPADAAAAAQPWGNAIAIPGLAALGAIESNLQQVACTSPGNCTAVGSYTFIGVNQNTQQPERKIYPLVVDQVNGVWGNAYELPGNWDVIDPDDVVRAVTKIACAPDGGCVAAGEYSTGQGGRVFVARRVGGVWTDTQPLPNTSGLGNIGYYFLRGSSCSSSGNCAIVGFYFTTDNPSRTGGWIASLTGGVWQTTIDVPLPVGSVDESMARSVSCPADGACSVAGQYRGSDGNYHALVVDQSAGVWGDAEAVPDESGLIDGRNAESTTISCSSAGNCSLGGNYGFFNNDTPPVALYYPFVADRIAGAWGNAQPVTLPGVDDSGIVVISCPTDGNCSAIGRFHDPGVPRDPNEKHDSLFVVERRGGSWTTPVPMAGLAALNTANDAGIESISCAAPGVCAATGYYTDATGKVPFVVNSAGGVWGAPIPVPGLRGSSIGTCELNIWGNNCPTGRSVSCSSTVLCIVVGNTYVAGDATLSIRPSSVPVSSGFIAEYFVPPAPVPTTVAPVPEPESPAIPAFTG